MKHGTPGSTDTTGRQAGRVDWVDASPRVARNNCAVGPVVQKHTRELETRDVHDYCCERRAPTGLRPALIDRKSVV